MKPAPIQLLRYIVEQVRLDLAPGYEDPEPKPAAAQDRFNVDVEPIQLPSSEAQGDLRLTIHLNDGAETWRYYRARLTLRGWFKVVDPSPPPQDELSRYFVVTAATVLYGAARALLIQLTATTPYPRLVLPMVTFNELAEVVAAQATEESIDEAAPDTDDE